MLRLYVKLFDITAGSRGNATARSRSMHTQSGARIGPKIHAAGALATERSQLSIWV